MWMLSRSVNGSAHIVHTHAPSAEARQLVEAGERDWQLRTPAGLSRALNEFSAAIGRDPDYAEAYAGIANCYNLMREFTLMPASSAYPLALAAAQRAVKLDPSLAAGHRALAFVDAYWLWDIDAAQHEFETAIALDPNSSLSHHWFGTFLSARGNFTGALSELAKAQALDPASAALRADRGVILYAAGHHAEGMAQLRGMEEADPGFMAPHKYLADIYLLSGADADYLRESEAAARLMGDLDALKLVEAGRSGLASGGHTGLLNALLEKTIEQFTRGRATAYSVARLEALLGRDGDAVKYLGAAIDRHESDVIGFAADLAFARLKPLAAFRDLQARIERHAPEQI